MEYLSQLIDKIKPNSPKTIESCFELGINPKIFKEIKKFENSEFKKSKNFGECVEKLEYDFKFKKYKSTFFCYILSSIFKY